ncbi:hypothetical protein LINPERHAP2_LOCUS27592 [Linum perenne]
MMNRHPQQPQQHQQINLSLLKLESNWIASSLSSTTHLLNPSYMCVICRREREFELRWKMLSDFRLRTRALADILYQSSSSKRPVEESVDASEFSRSIESHEQAHMKHSFFRHDQEEVLQHLVFSICCRQMMHPDTKHRKITVEQ